MFPSHILGQGSTVSKNRNVLNAVKIFFCFCQGMLGMCETIVNFLNKAFWKYKHNSSTVYSYISEVVTVMKKYVLEFFLIFL